MDNTNKKLESTSAQSYEDCRNRFNTASAAADYANKHMTSLKGKREMHCIASALAILPAGSLILDLPCGTGRITYSLSDLGYQLVAADYSHHMVQVAKSRLQPHHRIQFETQDILNIKHPDHTFDAVLCNRLFHHYPTSHLRQMALLELKRVSKGPLIISFFNSYSLSAQWQAIKKLFHSGKSLDRQPISFYTFKKDVEACGLKIEKTFYCARGLSPQTYVRLIKQ